MQFIKRNPCLYGITENNSNRTGKKLWGKNEFNSTFPLALCLYMRDENIDPVSVIVKNGIISTEYQQWEMHEIVGKKLDNPEFFFEKKFQPYDEFISDNVKEIIDLIVRLNDTDEHPLEIKLTVVPDSSTANSPENNWGPELVIRPVSSAYATMGVASGIKNDNFLTNEITQFMKTTYDLINDWNDKEEVKRNKNSFILSFDHVLKLAENIQKPFLIQTIWKTEGKTFEFSENCFDVFVWSDISILKLPILLINNTRAELSRPLREIVRSFRAMYEILTHGEYNYEKIYRDTSLTKQTDKAYSVTGKKLSKCLNNSRLYEPKLPKDVIKQIILNGGEKKLNPERRLDMAVKLYLENDGKKFGSSN